MKKKNKKLDSQFSPWPRLIDNIPSLRAYSLFLLTVPAVVCNVNIGWAYFQTSSGITIREGSSFNSSVSHRKPLTTITLMLYYCHAGHHTIHG